MKFRFAFFILLLGSLTLRGQDTTQHFSIGIAPMYGVILAHHPEIQYLINGHIPAIEAELAFATDGSKPWHHAFNFPTWGFSFNAYDLNSPYLGNAYATRIFYDLPFNKSRSLGLKMGLGLGYVEKPFDKDENYHNLAIGSAWNASLGLNLYGRIPLSQKWTLKPGIAIHHLSNGALKMPNAGINLVFLKILLTYDPKGFHIPERKKSPPATSSPSSIYIGGSYGVKEIFPIGGPLYSVVNVFGIYDRRVNTKSSFGAEIGLNYNTSLEYRISGNSNSGGKSSDDYRPYIAGLYQLHFDPVGIRFEIGSYLFPQFTLDGMVFLRYQVLYNINDIQVFFGLKSHFGKADNVELGIAYKLK